MITKFDDKYLEKVRSMSLCNSEEFFSSPFQGACFQGSMR